VTLLSKANLSQPPGQFTFFNDRANGFQGWQNWTWI